MRSRRLRPHLLQRSVFDKYHLHCVYCIVHSTQINTAYTATTQKT
jgi:hypothetical protein